jgi:hypothetical protein
MTLTLITTYLHNFGTKQISPTLKLHAFSNLDLTNTWTMLVNNYTSDQTYTHPLHAPYAIPKNPTHGYMYYLPTNNSRHTPYAPQDITR